MTYRPLIFALTLLLVGCADSGPAPRTAPAATSPGPIAPSAPAPAGRWPLDQPLPLDPAVRQGKLDNGLVYYVRAHDEPRERVELRLVVAAGSALEDDDQRGLAHFLEHMAFNGTEHFEKQELVEYLESIGMRFGPDINAYTSFDETVYMLTVPTDRPDLVENGFLILQEWAHNIRLDPEEVDKERGVVLEEWRLGRGAQARMMDRQFPVLFHGSKYAERLPIGAPEIIETAPPERLNSFYRRWYRPDKMAVVVVGQIDPDQTVDRIRQGFASFVGPDITPEEPVLEVPPHAETLFDVQTDPEATLTKVDIYHKRERRPDGTARDYRRSLTERLYHGMLNDRLRELARRPDPPFLFAGSGGGGFVAPLEVLFQTAGVPDGEVRTGLEALLTEVERVEHHGFSATELDRARTELLRFYENAWIERDKVESSSLAGEYVRNFLEGEPSPGIDVEWELARELLPQITLEKINGVVAEWLADSSHVVLVQAPESIAEALPSIEELKTLFEEVAAREVDPWVDRVREEPLLGTLPEPGSVTAEARIEELGVTEWTLSNGARVVLKPTDFQNDEIVLRGFSPGGSSLVEDEEWPSALFASGIVAAGGLGEFDRVELEKALAGKLASANLGIGELEESVSASSTSADLETMFQLLYLRFTAPRRDPDAFASLMARLRAWVEHRQEDPGTVFSDRWEETVSQNHPRRRPTTTALLEEVDLDSAMEIYRDRFSDAGEFTFVIVGTFELAGIQPLVERYLGSLPATGRDESWRDPGVEPPSGNAEVVVHKGLEPKSRVQLLFHGESTFDLESLHAAISLGQALRIRLREVLREDMGNTYGVSVGSHVVDRPRAAYSSTIAFGCAPESVEESLEALHAELDRFRIDGPDAEVVAKVQEAQRRQRETSLRENGFWVSVLTSYYRRGDDPRLLLDFDRLIDGLSSERLREAAVRYLDPARTVQGILYPEAGSETGD